MLRNDQDVVAEYWILSEATAGIDGMNRQEPAVVHGIDGPAVREGHPNNPSTYQYLMQSQAIKWQMAIGEQEFGTACLSSVAFLDLC